MERKNVCSLEIHQTKLAECLAIRREGGQLWGDLLHKDMDISCLASFTSLQHCQQEGGLKGGEGHMITEHHHYS